MNISDNCSETTYAHTPGLQIRLKKQTYVFPWSQFVFAEGGADEIRMAFSTHDIVITGGGLGVLLPEIRNQRLTLLKELFRAESFTAFSGVQITGISIKKVE